MRSEEVAVVAHLTPGIAGLVGRTEVITTNV